MTSERTSHTTSHKTSATIELLDWAQLATQLGTEGHVLLPGLLAAAGPLAQDLGSLRRVSLVSADLGQGDLGQGDLYCYGTDLPQPLASLRQLLHPHLALIANQWNEALGSDYRFPDTLPAFLQRHRQARQQRALSHLNRLRESDYLALHQRSTGQHVFPLQVVGLLSTPAEDFTGGEFVMIEQRPRMQSRPIVLPLRQGDAALIGTAQRPFRGSRGYYRVNLRHAISRVRRGERLGLELFFHDAP